MKNLFYYNQKTGETVNFELNFDEEGIGFEPLIKGQVKKTYCGNCNNIIYVYCINEINCEEYNESEIIKLVENGIKKYKESLKQRKITKIKEIESNREYSINIIEYKNNFFANDNNGACAFVDGSQFKSNEEALIEVYRKAKKRVDMDINRKIKSINDHYNEIQNSKYYIELDLENHDEMTNLISDMVHKRIVTFPSEHQSINCPNCDERINKQLYEGVPCPKCKHELDHAEVIYD
ncbi:MAG: hypothetical protein UHW99_02580 [Methanobrevibacter sp.]|nr:hypothetical protein [Methanobrevibacter sp.]